MEQLAALMESCDGLVGQPDDWRNKASIGASFSEETCSIVAFDALCTLSEFHHRRGNVGAALTSAGQALYIWFAATTVGLDGDGMRVSGGDLCEIAAQSDAVATLSSH
jgi:hypothetical protein